MSKTRGWEGEAEKEFTVLRETPPQSDAANTSNSTWPSPSTTEVAASSNVPPTNHGVELLLHLVVSIVPSPKSSVSRSVTPAGVTGVLNLTRTLSELPTFTAETMTGV